MYKLFLFVIILCVASGANSQITTSPALPTASGSVKITFDSSKETRLGYYTGDLYTHTGVKIEGDNDWQHVIGTWGNNSVQPKLTYLGNGIYELEIEPDINSFYSVGENEKVLQLAFVFRSADASKQTNDLFVNVYEEGLVVEIAEPSNNSILLKNNAVTITANSSVSASLKLLLNETVLTQTNGFSVSTTKTFTEAGNFWLVAQAEASGETVYDSVYICVKEDVVNATKPVAYRKGINYPDDHSAALVLWAPGKEFVFAVGDFSGWKPKNEFQMKKDGDYFWTEIENLEKGKEYAFQYFIDNEIKIADPYTEKILDPWNDKWISPETYPGLMEYPEGKAEGIVSVLQTGQEGYHWEVTGFNPGPKDQMIIYELLVRDFTEEHTYQSVIEKLDYLEDLRINVLELMPVNEFEGNSSWGYNTSFYFAPDKYYGPKNNLKKLIDECHKRGIAVVLDMVLNHSYGQSPFVQMYMDNWVVTEDNPWYNQESNFQNTSLQFGFDFNHESEATRELVDSVNSFWMNEYKVDGFRFDFTKGFSNTPYGSSSWGSEYDAARINNLKRMTDEIRNRKEDAIIIFEHLAYNSEETVLADYGILLWGNMNYNYGEAAKGNAGNSDLTPGLYTSRYWKEPNLVTYMESHDEERITYNCLQGGKVEGGYSVKELSNALDRMELASVFLIPLPGPKMIWQFGERGYDQSINSYGGRLNEKPPFWEYLDNQDRLDLFSTVAKLNFLKQNYEEFTPQVFTSHLDGEIKWFKLNSGSNHVFVLGNFSTHEITSTLSFSVMGLWHEYFSKATINVNIPPQNLTLAPGEYRLYSTRELEDPEIKTNTNTIQNINSGIYIYPNPAEDFITIQTKEFFKRIEVYSTSGNIVFKSENQPLKKLTLNTSKYSPGIYLVRAESDSKISTGKFIIR
ncbi:MAG: T9SS type A sorting domain-containing protein [Prolixibacteraceae bacterium]|nr:T9SS type A sorting domain-containing protein [Prolixibacteraceae bacterium]